MLFQGPRFYIEALFWLSGTTDIHEHAFSGAFAVLSGSSVHSHWRFIPERTINSRMLCGRMDRVSTEILRPGSVQPINSGNQLIHQLFHLDLPSVTIVVRTYQDRHRLPQYKYLPPGLAIDHEDQDPLRLRRLKFIEGMAQGRIGDLSRSVQALFEHCDLETVYHTLSLLTRMKVDREVLGSLFAAACRRHGEIVDLFRQVCEAERRVRIVVGLRSKVADPEQRFLLALLMLMPDRDAILETMGLQGSSLDSLSAIESLVAGMSSQASIGFALNEQSRLIFRSLVEGLGPDALVERLRSEFQSESVDTHQGRLLGYARELARSDLFYPLFSKSPFREGCVDA
jgi:hypothetical protein